jgi:nucleotide-binding universal stress UspA family protein
MLRDATAGWPDKYPEVRVTHAVIHGDNPVRALNDATDDGDLVVVGARGLGGFDTLALGSVADGLVRYARRRIAIARAPSHRS